MEVKIGVKGAPRELVLETELSAEQVAAAVTAALAGDDGVFSLADARGRQVLVPAEKLAYVEIGERPRRARWASARSEGRAQLAGAARPSCQARTTPTGPWTASGACGSRSAGRTCSDSSARSNAG